MAIAVIDNDLQHHVESRIVDLGFDAYHREILSFAIGKAKEIISSKINSNIIPEGLTHIFIDMSAGLYLETLKARGKVRWNGSELNFDSADSGAVESITEGDVSVKFKTSEVTSTNDKFDELVQCLLNPDESIFYRYRRFIW